MNANDPSNMSLNDLQRRSGELTNRLAFAGEYSRRKAARARVTRKQYVDHRCDHLMTFMDFKQQGRRNKILREYGREPVYLPGEGKHNTIH